MMLPKNAMKFGCAVFGLILGLGTASVTAEPKLQEFAEKEVAGSKDDFMIVRHLKLRGSNQAIGWKLAEIASTRHGVKPNSEASEGLREQWQFCKKTHPNHYARAVGAALYFDIPVDRPADTLALLYNMDVAPACSVVYYPPAFTQKGHATLSRNFDFSTATFAEMNGQAAPAGTRSMTADPYIIEMYPAEGYASLFVCAYDLLGACLDGINSEGLTVALLAVDALKGEVFPPAPAGPKVGLDEIEVTRFLLDQCATVEEASAVMEKVPVYYSWIPCHYIIGDRSGRSIVWEYSLDDLRERHVVEGKGQPQVITNHFVYKYETDPKTRLAADAGESVARYRRLEAEVGRGDKARTIDEIKRANSCVKAAEPAPAGASAHPRLNRTLWHAIYDCTELTMDVDFYLGEDRATKAGEKRSGYLRFKLDSPKTIAARKSQG
jgi:acyl-CoA:6-aminopenicillanic acid acyl transferase